MESAQAKNQALREAGAVVPTSYEAFEDAIKETYDKLVSLLVSLKFPSLLRFLPSSHPLKGAMF